MLTLTMLRQDTIQAILVAWVQYVRVDALQNVCAGANQARRCWGWRGLSSHQNHGRAYEVLSIRCSHQRDAGQGERCYTFFTSHIFALHYLSLALLQESSVYRQTDNCILLPFVPADVEAVILYFYRFLRRWMWLVICVLASIQNFQGVPSPLSGRRAAASWQNTQGFWSLCTQSTKQPPHCCRFSLLYRLYLVIFSS